MELLRYGQPPSLVLGVCREYRRRQSRRERARSARVLSHPGNALLAADQGGTQKKASSPLLGVGLSYYKAIEHAIWGVDLVFGGRSEVVLNPTILTVVLAIKIPVKAVKAAFLVIEPGANIGWVDGYVKWNDQPSGDAQRVDLDTPGPGFGGQLAIGADWYFTKNLGVNVRGGYRYLKVEFNHYDSNGDPYFSIDGENVEPDLSGMYGVAGVSLRF